MAKIYIVDLNKDEKAAIIIAQLLAKRPHTFRAQPCPLQLMSGRLRLF